jgi:hypothetical protein
MNEALAFAPESPDPSAATPTGPAVREVRHVPFAALKVDQSVQQRAGGTAKRVVAEYAEAMRNGAKFLPPTVFSSDGLTFILADGFHRIAAHRLAHPNTPDIECDILAGDRDDALFHACGANALHGMRRTPADKRKSVVALLRSDKWSKLSDREIARQCDVSHPFVAKVRKQVETFPDAGQSANNQGNPSCSGQDATEVGRPLRRHRGRTSKRSARSKGMRSGQKTPVPFLAAHTWWLVDDGERLKFLREVGVAEIFEKLLAADPGFDFLAFAKKRLNPIGASAAESDTLPDVGSSTSQSRSASHAVGRI